MRRKLWILGLALLTSCGDDDPDTVPPGAIQDLAGARTGVAGEVKLTWTAPGDDGSDGTASSYDIRYSPTLLNGSSWDNYNIVSTTTAPKAAGSSEELLVQLEKGSWFFAVRARDEAGNLADISNNTRVTTQDTLAPPAITDLAIVDRTTRSVSLTWTSPKDTGPEAAVASYELRYHTEALDETSWLEGMVVEGVDAPQKPGSEESQSVEGLTPGVLYWFGVRSTDAFGNESALSNVVQVATTVPSLEQLTMSQRTIGAVYPDWSKDGTRIALSADWATRFVSQVYVTDPQGSNFNRLTTQPDGTFSLRWSPDGKQIAFVGSRPDGRDTWLELWTISSTPGGGPPVLVAGHPPDRVSGMAWSPDGSRIAYASISGAGPLDPASSNIFVVDADGNNEETLLSVAGSVGSLDWHPDGTSIIFDNRPTGEESDIWSLAIGSSTPTRLTTHPGLDFGPRFSPDGTRLAFSSDRASGNPDIWIMNVKSGELVQVSVSENSESASTWSPDGNRLAYNSFDTSRLLSDIFIQDVGDLLP